MKQLLPIIFLIALINALFFSAQNLSAYNLDECLLEAVKSADDSVTAGQLREQCQKERDKVKRQQLYS